MKIWALWPIFLNLGGITGQTTSQIATFYETAPLDGCLSPDVIGRCTAKAKVDLIFLIDTADPNKNIQNVKKLIKEISTCISISDHLTSVSLLKYRQRLNLGIPLGGWDKYTQSKAKLRQHLDAITINHPSGAEIISNLGVALKSTDLILHGPGASAERYGKREDVPTILVILSDNPSNDLFQKERDRLSQQNVRIMTVGLADRKYYESISSKPHNSNLFHFNEGSEILLSRDSILSAICEAWFHCLK